MIYRIYIYNPTYVYKEKDREGWGREGRNKRELCENRNAVNFNVYTYFNRKLQEKFIWGI